MNIQKLFRRLFPGKERRAFNKMRRRHYNELISLTKETREWDWSWLHRMVIMQIKHMHEYYTAGNNVWQSDETKIPIIEQLNKILELEKELDRLEYMDFGVTYVFENGKVTCTCPDNFNEKYRKNEEEIQQTYEELYGLIGKNLRFWWD